MKIDENILVDMTGCDNEEDHNRVLKILADAVADGDSREYGLFASKPSLLWKYLGIYNGLVGWNVCVNSHSTVIHWKEFLKKYETKKVNIRDVEVGDEVVVHSAGYVYTFKITELENDDRAVFDTHFQGIDKTTGELGLFLPEEIVELRKNTKPKQIDAATFDLKTQPWFIRVKTAEEFGLVANWLKEEYNISCNFKYSNCVKYVTNVQWNGVIPGHVMSGEDETKHLSAKEIKLTFKAVVDNVEWPAVESDKERKLRELKEAATELNEKIKALESE
jgi:hypothetical protein